MRRPGRRRPERVAALIQEVLASAIHTRVKDPRIGFATLTGVTVSADYGHATVRVSVMGTEEEKRGAIEGLESAGGYLRSLLARVLPLRTVPELHFVLDRGLDHARRIDELLREASDADGEGG